MANARLFRADPFHNDQHVIALCGNRLIRPLRQSLPFIPGVVVRFVEDVNSEDIVDPEFLRKSGNGP